MTIALRQSTGNQEVPLGHFVDSTDGITAETALAIANTDIKIWKSGATMLVNKNTGGATHMSDGIYYAVLNATDTNTVGPLVIFVAVTGALAVRLECHVYEEEVFDDLYAENAVGYLKPTVAGRDIGVEASGAVSTVNAISTAVTVGSIATGGITSSSFAANAITASSLATDAVAEIADAVWDEAISGHLTAGSTGAALNAAGSAGDPWTTTLPGSYTGSQAGKMLSDILTDTGTTLQAELDGIQADTEDIQSRIPAALVSGRMDSSVGGYQTGMIPLFATTQGRSLDVTATGAAGIDWSNIENKTTIVDLENTSVLTASALVVPIALIDSNVDAILADTAEIGAGGAGLTALPWNAAWDAEVQSEVQDAIEANHLDHLLAVDYDPASKPGVSTALLNELVESDGGVSRYTANALEQAPSGGGGGTADWTADERTALRTILGIPSSGTTPEAPSAGALKVIDDFLDTEIADIQARLPAALTAGGNIKADVLAISGDATAADNLEAATDGTGYNVGNGSVVAASVTGAVGSVTGNVGGNVTGSVGSVASGGITAASIATGAIDADALAADAIDEIWDEVIEGSITGRQALRVVLAMMNKTTRSGSTLYFRDVADTKNRIAITIDSNADRTSVTRDLT